MDDIHNRLSSTNGHGSKHPMDKWDEWISKRHPELARAMSGELEEMSENLPLEENIEALHFSAGKAMLYAGSTILFNAMTGVLDEEPAKEPIGEVLNNLSMIKQRAHEWVDELFESYTNDYKEMQENNEADEEDGEDEDEDEDDLDLEDDDSELEDDNSELEDDSVIDHTWDEVQDEDSELEEE